jgi:hypothetical protein
MRIRRIPLAIALAVAAMAGVALAAENRPGGLVGGTAPTIGSPSIRILRARPMRFGVVRVDVRIAGWKMYPLNDPAYSDKRDGGHWHVYVDGAYNTLSNTRVAYTKSLNRGRHRIYAALVYPIHVALDPPVRSRTVVVHTP